MSKFNLNYQSYWQVIPNIQKHDSISVFYLLTLTFNLLSLKNQTSTTFELKKSAYVKEASSRGPKLAFGILFYTVICVLLDW